MSYLIQCAENVQPCPDTSQVILTQLTVADLAQIGLTSELILRSVVFGFSAVAVPALAAMAVSFVLKLVQKA